jgi:hypothetical protein
VDVSQSPLAELLPDRCTPEFRRLQAELSARHSYREAARLLEKFLPCGSVNHGTMRNRTHRIADDLEAAVHSPSEPDVATDITMAIDGAHIRAAHGYQARHIDVTVGKIEVAGKPPRRFALAPKGAIAPLATLRSAAGTRVAARPSRNGLKRWRIGPSGSRPRRGRRADYVHSGLVAHFNEGSTYRASVARSLCS